MDSLRQYTKMHAALLREKAAVEGRLRELTAVLSDAAPAPRQDLEPFNKPRKQQRRARNTISLAKAVEQVTKAKPLTKPEILAGVQKLGYRFSTKDPMNSLNVVLYSGALSPSNKLLPRWPGNFRLPLELTSPPVGNGSERPRTHLPHCGFHWTRRRTGTRRTCPNDQISR